MACSCCGSPTSTTLAPASAAWDSTRSNWRVPTMPASSITKISRDASRSRPCSQPCSILAMFRLDHLAGREAIFATSVLAEFDQTRRVTHRAHDLIELAETIAVPMREFRHVASREGRLLLGDRIQCDRRIGNDPRAIAARDLA